MDVRDSIFEAIRAGNLDLLRDILEQDPTNAAQRDANGMSALMLARYRSNDEILELLLKAAPPFDVFEAAAFGHADKLLDLLRDDASLALAYSPDGFTALHLAAYFGYADAVDLLLTHGADARATSRNPMLLTALHSAAAAQRHAIASTLLEHGADPDAIQAGGFTPLHSAAHQGDTVLVDVLLGRGANAHIISDDGRDAAAMAAEKNHSALAARLQAH